MITASEDKVQIWAWERNHFVIVLVPTLKKTPVQKSPMPGFEPTTSVVPNQCAWEVLLYSSFIL